MLDEDSGLGQHKPYLLGRAFLAVMAAMIRQGRLTVESEEPWQATWSALVVEGDGPSTLASGDHCVAHRWRAVHREVWWVRGASVRAHV